MTALLFETLAGLALVALVAASVYALARDLRRLGGDQ